MLLYITSTLINSEISYVEKDHGIKKDMFSCSQIKIYTTVAVIKETYL